MRTFLMGSLAVASMLVGCGDASTRMHAGAGGTSADQRGGTGGSGGTSSGSMAFGGNGGTMPVASGGKSIDWDACSGAYAGYNCGGRTVVGGSTNGAGSIGYGGTAGDADGFGGAGGAAPGVPDGGLSVDDVLTLEMPWSTSPDAGALLWDVILQPNGGGTCRQYNDGWHPVGQIPPTDTEIATLLSRPGTVDTLATTCPVKVADAGYTITTTFINGSQVAHLVFDTCSTDTLAALTAAMRRIGEACIGQTTLVSDE